MDKITRKELKTDRFVLEVERSIDYLSEHRKRAVLIGGVAVFLVLAILLTGWYRSRQHTARQEALTAALDIQNASVGQAENPFLRSFATQQEKDEAATKAFTEIVNKYSGSEEALIARFHLGAIEANKGHLAEAEKWFKQVADSRNREYGSLAALSLAEIYSTRGRHDEAEKLLRALIEKPTAFVSKEQATLALASVLIDNKPEEARKLLEPLRTERGTISRASITLLSRLEKR